MTQLQQQATTNPNLTFWDIITGDLAGSITVVLLLVAYILYALAIIVFCFFYTLYGTVLYVLGPLVLALIPVSGIGQLGRTYAINLMIWNAWGILYSVFGALITAIHFNQVNNVLGNGFLGFLRGVPDSVMLGLVSIFYALAVALVPFIAKRVISGDVGSTAFALVRAALPPLALLWRVSADLPPGLEPRPGPPHPQAGAGAGSSSTSGSINSSMPPPAPATSMAGFLQSGLSSAMNSNSSPTSPVVSGGTSGSSGKQNGTRTAAAGHESSGYIYRPRSVTQAVTFNVARALGRAAGRQSPEDN